MIADLALRWVVTVLFALSAVECTYALLGSRGRPGAAVGQLLHLAMAIAMMVMAWPRGAELPTLGPMYFFLAAAVWFLAGLLRSGTTQGRVVDGYHAAMMLAMAWMYAAMNGNVLARQPETVAAGGHEMHAMHMGAARWHRDGHGTRLGTAALDSHHQLAVDHRFRDRRRRVAAPLLRGTSPGRNAAVLAFRNAVPGNDGGRHGDHVRRDVVAAQAAGSSAARR